MQEANNGSHCQEELKKVIEVLYLVNDVANWWNEVRMD